MVRERVEMLLDALSTAALALHRFGFGARSGSISAIASDPRGALLAELERPSAGILNGGGLLSSGEAARRSYDDVMARRMAYLARARQIGSSDSGSMSVVSDMPALPRTSNEPLAMRDANSAKPAMGGSSAGGGGKLNQPLAQELFIAETRARANSALNSPIGFVERLVWFWSNHFCIAARRVILRAIAGAYEREAIRPHVLGQFADMLLAVESHPAMLDYLDNSRSIGPNSPRGLRRGRGLNENLAREILELHTLGVRTVYSQSDVTSFAKVLTGWTMVPVVDSKLHGNEFEFDTKQHEPGAQTVIGKVYDDEGVNQGRAVLRRERASA